MGDNPDVDHAIEELTAGTSVDVASISAIALDTTRFTPAESIQVLEGVVSFCEGWIETIRHEDDRAEFDALDELSRAEEPDA